MASQVETTVSDERPSTMSHCSQRVKSFLPLCTVRDCFNGTHFLIPHVSNITTSNFTHTYTQWITFL